MEHQFRFKCVAQVSINLCLGKIRARALWCFRRVFPTGVSNPLLSEMTTSSTSFVILEKDHALIERGALVYELLLRLRVIRVTERRGRTRQNHRRAKLLEKTDLAQLTRGPAKHYIHKVRREIRRHEYLYYVKDWPGRRAGKKVGSRQSCRSYTLNEKTLSNCYGKQEPGCRAHGTGARASARRR